ncbi:RNA pseudouridylate synthase domain-containing protein 1-like [Saccoglossus kowalevskii]
MLEMTYFIEDMEMNKVPTLQDISIIYKDDNYIIVNKHYDVRINHEGPCEAVTVDTQLKHLYPELVDSQLVHGFRFVHQLDYSTSGALCLALNKKACSIASKLFMKRLVIKHYLAIVSFQALITQVTRLL